MLHVRARHHRLLTFLVAMAVGIGCATAGSARAATPDDKALAALRARADKAQASLAAGTKALEAGQLRLVEVTHQADEAVARADRAAERLRDSQEQVSAFAAAVYRRAMPDPLVVLLSGDAADGPDALRAMGYLQVLGGGHTEVLREVRVDQQQAEQLRATADDLLAQAAEEAADLERQVGSLQDQAARSASELQLAVKEYEEAKAREAARLAAEAAAKAAAKRKALALAQEQARTRLTTVSGEGCSGAGGSYPNGLLPSSALCALASAPGHQLRGDAAAAFDRLSAAYAQRFGSPICITDSYRSYSEQAAIYRSKPSLAALPGRSNHGWGLAVDLCGGIQQFGSAQHQWMKANASAYGWFHPSWAEPRGSKPEPWHWEFGRIS